MLFMDVAVGRQCEGVVVGRRGEGGDRIEGVRSGCAQPWCMEKRRDVAQMTAFSGHYE
jgi:hypothetical protein